MLLTLAGADTTRPGCFSRDSTVRPTSIAFGRRLPGAPAPSRCPVTHPGRGRRRGRNSGASAVMMTAAAAPTLRLAALARALPPGPVPVAGAVGSLAPAALAEVVGGVVTAGREGGAVVGTVFVSGRAGPSPILSTAITDPKPTRNAATHASGITTARPPIREKKERSPSLRRLPRSIPDGRRLVVARAPSVSGCAAGLVGAPSASRCAAGSVASSTNGPPLALISEVVTIGRLPQSIRSLGSARVDRREPQGTPGRKGAPRAFPRRPGFFSRDRSVRPCHPS